LGGVGFQRTVDVGVGVGFCPTPTPEIQLDHFLHYTPNLGISAETYVETENSCCAPRFPLIASCCKIFDSQTSFNLY